VNLQLYFRVAWRFKWLVGGGFVLAVMLAFLSMAKVSFAHGMKVTYRSPVVYQSEAILLVSQPGFPWGRATPTVGLGADANKPDPAGAVASQNRLTSIAVLYAQMANSDSVQRLLAKSGPPVKRKDINAAPVVQAFSSVGPLLPLISITGNGPSQAIAESYARREVKAFLRYLADEQHAARIPDPQRVVVQVLNEAQPAKVVQGRKKTMSILVFLTMMIAVWGLAFMLDNLRPAGRRSEADADAPPASAPPRVVGLRKRPEETPEVMAALGGPQGAEDS
jgi:hypothetical protein